jgi:Uma2 family endonuclease
MTISPILLDHAVPGPPQGQWTPMDWERLPDDGNRYEVINGVLCMSTTPSRFHQWIIACFIRYIGTPLNDQDLGIALFAPIGVLLSSSDVVQPDFLVVLRSHFSLLRNRRVMGAPDMVVEVLSPGNSSIEMQNKQDAYARAGVPEYVLVDPETHTLHYYRLERRGLYMEGQVFAEGQTISFECAPSLKLQVELLFTDVPDTVL